MRVKTKERRNMESKKEGVPHRRVSKESHRVTTVPQIQTTAGPVRASRQSLWEGKSPSKT